MRLNNDGHDESGIFDSAYAPDILPLSTASILGIPAEAKPVKRRSQMKRKILFAALLSFLVAGIAAPVASFADEHSKIGIQRMEAAIKEMKEAITHFEDSEKATKSPHADAAIKHAKEAITHAEASISHAKQVP